MAGRVWTSTEHHTPMSLRELRTLFSQADAAGKAAAKATVPVPMTVGTPTTVFGNAIDTRKPVYVVPGGVCGFAWVRIIPGNSRAAHFALKNCGAHKGYPTGVAVYCHEYGQSMTLKEAYAEAYARVLSAAGIRAYAESRMD